MYILRSEDILGCAVALFNVPVTMCFFSTVILPVFGSQGALAVFVTYQECRSVSQSVSREKITE